MTWCRKKASAVFGCAVLALCAEGRAERATYVLFTVDVETRSITGHSLDQDIWGQLPGLGEKHGIERMMDVFDKHSVKCSFFFEANDAAERFNPTDLSKICSAIVARGYDVELHIHPGSTTQGKALSEVDLPTQVKVLGRGMERLQSWAGVSPVAHRAGAFAANLDTVAACKAVGLSMEFSCNTAWPTSPLGLAGLGRNAPFVREGVLCVPVTAYVEAQVGNWKSNRFLDIESSSPAEIRKVIADLHSNGVRTAVIVMHSFSFSRSGKPNYRVERALDDLLADLTQNPNVKVVSARQLHEIWQADPAALTGNDYVPTTGLWMTYCRSWTRLGEGWRNVVVAIGPIAVMCGLAAILALWRRRRNRMARREARALGVAGTLPGGTAGGANRSSLR